jgi:glutathione S-transferase
METSAELLYLLKFADKNDEFGFKDELERSECLQWLFFWHGSGAPYQGNLGFFRRAAEQLPCKSNSSASLSFHVPSTKSLIFSRNV